jgi:trehalose 6-phosphate synthase
MNIAHELKSMKVARHTGFFLHIPFPPADMFMKLPWRAEILHSLLQFDLVGFQTLRDRRNFIQCLRNLKYPGLKISGRGSVLKAILADREVRIGSFPISIDFNGFSRRAESRDVSERGWYFHEAIPDQQIILSIDRLDYTKGILERLEAFRITLRKNSKMHGNVTFVQVIIPSREELPEYQNLKAQIEQAVTEINGEFTYPGWVPIHHFYRQLELDELIAYYRAAEIALVTPLRDGMNLVAKEYCACSLEGKGVLILSEFAGAAAELQKGALLVNPYDMKGVVDTICMALDMPTEERRSRMKKLRSIIRKRDIFWWVDSILQTAFAKRLKDFPQAEEYVPKISLKKEC